MAQGPNPISTAFWTYVLPMTATRAMRVGIVLFVVFLAAVIALFVGGFLASGFVTDALFGLRHFLVMVGLPVGAVLLSEIPLRDGITHKTLLYPLLGPVPRVTLALVRVTTTAAVLAVGVGALLLLIRVLLHDGFGFFPRELLAVILGSFAYVGAFGLIHLYNRRGLITGLVILFLLDIPLGKLPFTLRNLSPSYHVGVISSQEESIHLPISFGAPETSVLWSSLVLLAIAAVFTTLVAIGFKRKNLGELC
jgi:MFS family permease